MNRKEFSLLVEGWRHFLNEDDNLENINDLSEEVYKAYFEKVYNYTPQILEYEFKKRLGTSEAKGDCVFKPVSDKTQEELYQEFLAQEAGSSYEWKNVRNELEKMSDEEVKKYQNNTHFHSSPRIPLAFSYLWESCCSTKDIEEINDRIENHKKYLESFTGFIPKPFYSHVDLVKDGQDYYFEFTQEPAYSYIDQEARKSMNQNNEKDLK